MNDSVKFTINLFIIIVFFIVYSLLHEFGHYLSAAFIGTECSLPRYDMNTTFFSVYIVHENNTSSSIILLAGSITAITIAFIVGIIMKNRSKTIYIASYFYILIELFQLTLSPILRMGDIFLYFELIKFDYTIPYLVIMSSLSCIFLFKFVVALESCFYQD